MEKGVINILDGYTVLSIKIGVNELLGIVQKIQKEQELLNE